MGRAGLSSWIRRKRVGISPEIPVLEPLMEVQATLLAVQGYHPTNFLQGLDAERKSLHDLVKAWLFPPHASPLIAKPF